MPLDVTPYIDLIHFDTLYLKFSRPLAQTFNFSELLTINIPSIKTYQYDFNQTDPTVLRINFTFNVTVLNTKIYLNFSKPNDVFDVFGYSLVGRRNDTLAPYLTRAIITTELNYYIYYSPGERDFADTLGIITLSFGCVGLLFSMIYYHKSEMVDCGRSSNLYSWLGLYVS